MLKCKKTPLHIRRRYRVHK